MKRSLFILLVLVTNLIAQEATPPGATPEVMAQGKALFEDNCKVCHGATGEGNGPGGLYLNPRPRNFVTETFKNGNKPDQVFKTISEGLPPSAMPAFDAFTPEQRWSLVFYVLSFHH